MTSLLAEEAIRDAVYGAWLDSRPGAPDAHEEGGFILEAEDGTRMVERWPRGRQYRIDVPSHPDGRRNGLVIIATFHTHPLEGPDIREGPSLADVRGVINDPDLRREGFRGEYVITRKKVYLIDPNGIIEEVGTNEKLLRREA